MQVFNAFPLAGLLFIAISIAIKIRILKRSGIIVSKSRQKIKKTTRFFYLVFGIIFLIWMLEIMNPVFQISFSILPEWLTIWLTESLFLKVSGVAVILLSLILLTITLVHFKTSLRFGLDENNTGKLITTGIFSFSRNPFFLSLDLYFLGTALIFTSLFFIGFAVLAFAGINLFIQKEEKFLRKMYGNEYKNYSTNVRKYI